ncbi:uncharacterized protein [Watersipora subatra]|uniref:uncharacterized protein isoform X2 n=1 Tax=Watersipora subatra TaxID=2589382 RepID=UPI00355C4BB3
MDVEELRARNRALISKLVQSQKAAQRSSYDASRLGRDLDSLQEQLDRLAVQREPTPSPRNTNNNNISDMRFDSRAIVREHPPYDVSSSPLNISPASDKLTIVRTTPEETKTVRRRLEEMNSPIQLDKAAARLETPSPEPTSQRAVLSESTNKLRTPKKTTRSSQATPKSILKHRRLIDSNVQVKSKFVHTPGWMERAKHTRVSVGKRSDVSKKSTSKEKVRSRKVPSQADENEFSRWTSYVTDADTINKLESDLSDPVQLKAEMGNLRKTVENESEDKGLVQGQMTPDPNTMVTPTSLSGLEPSPDVRTMSGPSPDVPTMSVIKQRMMGYDWIAALLDQSDAAEVADKHESYFRELREFRRLHRDECENDAVALPTRGAGSLLVDTADIAPAIPEAHSPNHTCIHSYTVNSRLYTVPMNSDKAGESRCAVCSKKKQLPSSNSPSFVRVSIPRCTLSSPYRIKPHRRKSFDPSDSVALSKHCLAGWSQQRPLKLPTGRNVDLANETNRLKSKFTMTMAEAEDLARKSKSANGVTSRDIEQTTLYNRELKKVTKDLLEMSHAMQFQSQLFNKTSIH